METYTDALYIKGVPHSVCQDYALAGNAPFPYVILSDGCSSSAASDVGARILSHTALGYIKASHTTLKAEKTSYNELGRSIIQKAGKIITALHLDHAGLDATLIVGFLSHRHVILYIYGDGQLLLTHRSLRHHIWLKVTFTPNMPYYLSYQIDADRNAAYFTQNAQKYVYHQKRSPGDPVIFKLPLQHFPIITAATDGLDSFLSRTGIRLEASEVIAQFTQFKTKSGAFLKRRLKRALKSLAGRGFEPQDDLAMGTFLTL